MRGIDLKIIRIKAGVRLYELAAEMGISNGTLSTLESRLRVKPHKAVAYRRALRHVISRNTQAAERAGRELVQ